MHALFQDMLDVMEVAFRDFEAALPKAKKVHKERGWVYGFESQHIHHALVQKLARIQSALRAAHILLRNGYIMEQAILCRAIHETNEDILFLVYAVTNDEVTPLHERYLKAFWEEEFDDFDDPVGSTQKREMIPRKKIQAYLAKIESKDLDPSRSVALSRTLSKAYSGFVHGASPQIMESYGGDPPSFHTQGMLGTPRIQEYTDDLWNYMYRGFLSHIFVAKAFGAAEHVDTLIKKKHEFEARAGKDY